MGQSVYCQGDMGPEAKGHTLQYIEEDLYNKSELLLKYNPDHPLLSNDPYQRTLAHFWVKFAEDKGYSIYKVFKTTGEEHEKAKKESLEFLRTIEEYAINGDKRFFGGEEIGIVDIAFGGIAHWLGVIEEVIGVKLFDAQEMPRLHAWMNNFKNVPLIKESLPDRDKLLFYFKGTYQRKISGIILVN